jgi:hypothetical protein
MPFVLRESGRAGKQSTKRDRGLQREKLHRLLSKS